MEVSYPNVKVEPLSYEMGEDSGILSNSTQNSIEDNAAALQKEIIHLKSQLKQATEQTCNLKLEKCTLGAELKREKELTTSLRNNISRLLKEKEELDEQLRTKEASCHHQDVQKVIAKLEQDIYTLEERLEHQRKQNDEGHMSMYNDLKMERRRHQEWKKTYLKTQLALMTFRRKLANVQERIALPDRMELGECLEMASNGDVEEDFGDFLSMNFSPENVTASINQNRKSLFPLKRLKPVRKPAETGSFGVNGQPAASNISDNIVDMHSVGYNQALPVKEETLSSLQVGIPTLPAKSSLLLDRLQANSRKENELPTVFIINEKNELVEPVQVNGLDVNSNVVSNGNESTGAVSFLKILRKDVAPANVFLTITPTASSLNNTINKPIVNATTSAIPIGTPLPERRFWCLKCDTDASKVPCGHSNLVVQTKEKEFPCPTCARVFNNRSHLKRHLMIHSGEKPWSCTYCEKRFNRKSHLIRHLLTHTGQKPFRCCDCSRRFADSSDLKRHKKIHLVQKNVTPLISSSSSSVVSTTSIDKNKVESCYPCTKCGKKFMRKSHLARHRLTHDNVHIYCDCGRVFKQNSHLLAHIPSCKRKRDAVEAQYKATHSVTAAGPTE